MASNSPQGASTTSVIASSTTPPAPGSTGLTTLQFWQQQLAVYQAEQTAAQSDLTVAQAAQTAASLQLATDTKELDKITSSIAAMRTQLATTTIPADAADLVKQITLLIIQQRGLQGAVLDGRDAGDAAQASMNAANATLARATARMASVQATIAQVKTGDALRQALKQAVTAAPLSTLKDDAATFFPATVKNATTRLGKNFPKEIIAIALKRHDTRTNRLTSLQTSLNNAQDALGTDLAANTGKQGVVGQKRAAFQRAQTALSQHVKTAADRFNRAKAVLQMLEAIEVAFEVAPKGTVPTVPDILTDAEKAQLIAPAPLAGPGSAAETTAEKIDTALNAMFAAQDALDAQILIQIKADVDTLSADPKIADKRTAITDALM